MIRIKSKNTCVNGLEGVKIKCDFKETNTFEALYVIAHLITQIHINHPSLTDEKNYEELGKIVKTMEANND